jgi:hypothetical protein
MKTFRLTKLESAAYTNGDRRFWRKVSNKLWGIPWATVSSYVIEYHCPYGKPIDRIILAERNTCGQQATITAITVEQRGGRWGWVVEVGA